MAADQTSQADRNRQSQAHAFVVLSTSGFQACEFVKHSRLVLFGDADAAVPDLNFDLTVTHPSTQQDATLTGIAQGVGQKVLQDPAQHQGVSLDPDRARAGSQLNAFFLGQGGKLDGQFLQQGLQVDGHDIGFGRPGVQFGNLQQGPQQILGIVQGAV